MELAFVKMHGLGNDFVVVDDREETWDFDEDAVRWICDRHFGVGGDGLILVRPATDPDCDYFMLYVNADGTTAEMCGNGIRCFAKWLVDRGIVSGDTLTVQTFGGPKRIVVQRDADGRMLTARVDMGRPVLEPALVPVDLPGEAVVNASLDTEAGTFAVTCVSMGNPHCVIWVDDVDEAPVETVGPIVETHSAFPRKTNVEFAEVASDEDGDRLRLRVWERGVGETLACGTGACATLVAAALAGKTSRSAVVELPGGELRVEWAGDDRVYMTGGAEEVFAGSIDLPDEEE